MPVRRLPLYVAAIVLLYVGSYVCLSVSGRFVPGATGINGVKWYDWAPAGLVSGYRQRRGLVYFYAPLVGADRNWWHRSEDARSGRYAIGTPATAAEWDDWRH